MTAAKLAGQIVFFTLLMGCVGYLSVLPAIKITPPQQTQLKLMIRHSGLVIGECTNLSATKLKNLPPNMQKPLDCPREKSSLLVKLYLEDALIFEQLIAPSGIHNDGVIASYQAFNVEAGIKHIRITATSETHKGEHTESFDEDVMILTDNIVVLQLDDQGFSVRGTES